ncbi:hypothetical protein, partial [uncultured Veillonella sp.]|uniref:hypothetical protein n=1 Tax=uncultured Veillonella sp. TaxID=159268 RepID=UPI0025FFE8CD
VVTPSTAVAANTAAKRFFHCNYPLGYNLCKTVKQVVNFQFNVEKIYLSVLKLLPYLILIVTEF